MTCPTPKPDAERHDRRGRRRVVALLPAAWLAGIAITSGLVGCAAPARRSTAPPPPLPADQAANVVLTAMAFLDQPYRRGGNGGRVDTTGAAGSANPRQPAADGFDCSGFTRFVYERSLGVVLPRTAAEQAGAATLAAVSAADLQAGDLVFFDTLKKTFSHVGIYVGDGRFIHAPRQGTRVRVEDLRGPAGRYWNERFDGARRPRAGAP